MKVPLRLLAAAAALPPLPLSILLASTPDEATAMSAASAATPFRRIVPPFGSAATIPTPLRGGTSSPLFSASGALASAEESSGGSVASELPPDSSKRAIVVGGGPVGLAAALTLASPPHSYSVTLFESDPEDASALKYDATRAYLYNVNARGQVFTKQFPSLQEKLEERGVSGMGRGLRIVPADPGVPIPEHSAFRATPVGKGDSTVQSYWLPRHEMVKLMYEVVMEHEEKRMAEGANTKMGRIEYMSGMECVGLNPVMSGAEGDSAKSGERVAISVKDKETGEVTSHVAELVVGCDGFNSKVRDCLLNGKDAFASWSGFNHKKFKVRKWKSPATDLRIKVLQFPPKFKIPDVNGTVHTTTSTTPYAIRSKYTAPTTFISLGLLPMIDDSAIRPINTITRPNHAIWNIDNGAEMKEWFKEAFPRLNFSGDGDSLVSDGEWERFAKAQGTRFPHCQYSPGLVARSAGGDCGVALCGDAVHAFPPDIGQGINAGLGDVVALDRALRGKDVRTGEGEGKTRGGNLGDAMREYEKVRGPETRALVKFSRHGAPYQYRQPLRKDRLHAKLLTMNVLLRMILNKLTFGFVPNASILMAMDPNLTFRQVMRRADLTTAVLTAVASLGALKVAGKTALIGKALAVLVGAARRLTGGPVL